jgi:hypothetical protein
MNIPLHHSRWRPRPHFGKPRYLSLCLVSLLSSCSSGSAEEALLLDTGPAISAVTDTLLFGVRDVAVTADQDIWVLSRHDPFVRRFAAGKLVASFGQNGAGPGEFRAPWSFVRGDRLIPPRIFDPGGRLILRIDSAGREAARFSFRTTWGFVRSDIEDVSYGQVFRALAPSDSELVSLVYLGDVGTTRDLRRSALVRFTANGKPLDTLVSFRNLFPPQTDRSSARWLVTVPFVAGCPDGTIAVFDGVAPEIRGYSRGAEPVWRIPMPPPIARRRAMPATDLARYVRYRVLAELLENHADTSTLERRVTEQLRTARSWYGSTTPSIVGLLCDDHGRVWLQRFDTRDDPLGRGRIWTVIGPGGQSASVRFPAGFAPVVFSDATMVGISRDSLGVESVSRVTLPATVSTPQNRK